MDSETITAIIRNMPLGALEALILIVLFKWGLPEIKVINTPIEILSQLDEDGKHMIIVEDRKDRKLFLLLFLIIAVSFFATSILVLFNQNAPLNLVSGSAP